MKQNLPAGMLRKICNQIGIGVYKFLMSRKTAVNFGIRAMELLILLLLCLLINSRGEQLPIKIFTSADGLGSSFVSYMMHDSRGFLWFCTRDGLSRFDGSRFVTYQVGDQSAPPGIESIFETSKGIYWITTTGGLYRFDPQKPAAQTNQNENRPTLNAQFINGARGSFYEDRAGNLWFGSDDLYRLEEKESEVSLQKFALNLPANPNIVFIISAIREARDGSLWITTNWGLVRRLPDGREIFYSNDNSRTDILNSVLEDREGRIWVGRSSGIYIVKPEPLSELARFGELTVRRLDSLAQLQAHTETEVQLPEKSGEIFKYPELAGIAYYKYLYQTSDGHIWISTGDGVVEFDGHTFLAHTTARGLLKGFGQMIEDTSGNLWLGWSTGLARLDRKGFTTFNTDDGLNNSTILSINETNDGRLYAPTVNFFLSAFNETGFQTIRPPLPPDARSVWTSNAVLQDSRGEWWFLTNEHLYHFAAQKDLKALAAQQPRAVYDSTTGLKGEQMFHIFEDSRSDIWISNRAASSENYGLARWDRGTQKFQTFSIADGFPANTSIASLVEDKAGNIWLGAYEEGGLFRYSNGRFTRIESADVPKGVITSLLVDQLGRLWVASSLEGLSRVDNPNAEQLGFEHFTIKNGLASNNVRSITEDNFGNIYAGTARGIDRLSADGKRIRHYSVSDGLAGDFVNAAFRDRRGVLWFGTPNGLSRLVPEQDKESNAPPILLGGLHVAGENRPLAELGSSEISNLELNYTQNNLQIDYFGIDFNAGESLRYQYLLEGADKDWSAPVEQRSVTYANLASGDYRFWVRAVSADGMVSKQPALVSFKITPPFWRRWWFLAGIILFAGFAVFSLDRYRLAKTRQVETALGKSIESETRFRTLAQTASDAIITIDTESNIVFVNEAVEKIFGYASAELIGEKLTILMPEGLRPQHDAGLTRYVLDNRKNIGWTGVALPGKHKSGALIPLELSFGEFELGGKRYFTGVARDISERKQAEEALQKSREERFKELERVRTRIAGDLHDDIGASLSQIAFLSQVAARSQTAESDGKNGHLQKISSVSVELMQAMGDIVWAINPRNDNLPNLIKRMRRFASDVFSARAIHFEFDAPEIENNAALGANIRREVFAVFKESVNNIARHSECKNAKVIFTLENNRLFLELKDDGRGFDVSEKLSESFSPETGGNGLLNMRRRAQDLGGSCEIVSEAGKGTVIKIEIPLVASQEIQTSQTATETGGDEA